MSSSHWISLRPVGRAFTFFSVALLGSCDLIITDPGAPQCKLASVFHDTGADIGWNGIQNASREQFAPYIQKMKDEFGVNMISLNLAPVSFMRGQQSYPRDYYRSTIPASGLDHVAAFIEEAARQKMVVFIQLTTNCVVSNERYRQVETWEVAKGRLGVNANNSPWWPQCPGTLDANGKPAYLNQTAEYFYQVINGIESRLARSNSLNNLLVWSIAGNFSFGSSEAPLHIKAYENDFRDFYNWAWPRGGGYVKQKYPSFRPKARLTNLLTFGLPQEWLGADKQDPYQYADYLRNIMSGNTEALLPSDYVAFTFHTKASQTGPLLYFANYFNIPKTRVILEDGGGDGPTFSRMAQAIRELNADMYWIWSSPDRDPEYQPASIKTFNEPFTHCEAFGNLGGS